MNVIQERLGALREPWRRGDGRVPGGDGGFPWSEYVGIISRQAVSDRFYWAPPGRWWSPGTRHVSGRTGGILAGSGLAGSRCS